MNERMTKSSLNVRNMLTGRQIIMGKSLDARNQNQNEEKKKRNEMKCIEMNRLWTRMPQV